MLPDERSVAGLTCSAVMAGLSEFVDGDMPAEMAGRIEAHVAECRQCERFGRDFSRLLDAMRRHLSLPDPLPDDVGGRLRASLP